MIKKPRKKATPLPPFGGHVEGKTYFCSYWQTTYTVLQLHGTGLDWSVTVRWADGHINTHCTHLGKRDKEVVSESDYMEPKRISRTIQDLQGTNGFYQ